MKAERRDHLSESEKRRISQIWNNEYPKSIHFTDASGFELYLSRLSNAVHFLFWDDSREIMAWACKFDRESERWFAIILDEKIHGKGKGSELLEVLKQGETALNGWVIDNDSSLKSNGKFYRSPLGFYLKSGFAALPEIRIDNEAMSAVKITWKAQ